MGTEAVLHRVRRASAVVFLDIDLHLLAPRFSATDETVALLARASRLVGPRHGGPESARIQVQTRVPDHPVLRAIVRGTPELLAADEEAMRREAGLPPFVALALVSGPLAPTYVEDLRSAATRPPGEPGISAPPTISELADDRFLIRAEDHRMLCDLLAEVPRPAGRGLRIEVDPVTL
jgi:primosomal protein N' (replication factor Y)